MGRRHFGQQGKRIKLESIQELENQTRKLIPHIGEIDGTFFSSF